MTGTLRPDTREEAAAKIPALHILMGLGWTYLPPEECLAKRGSERAVLMTDVLRDHLAGHRFAYRGDEHSLSKSAIDQIVRELESTHLNEGLLAANKRVHEHLSLGVTVTEFMPDGRRHAVTVPIIDWNNPAADTLHVTEELSVLRTNGINHFRSDVVCYVNGIPLAVIEAKRPGSGNPNKDMVDEGISQHLRNQLGDGIQDLYAYAQLLLSVSGTDGRYGTTETPKKFWATWREEEIAEAEIARTKDWRMSADQMRAIFADRPWLRRHFDGLWSGKVLPTDQDRLLISLLRPDRLLEFVRYFILFDRKIGKIAARYPQVFGTKAVIRQIMEREVSGSRKGGVIWHTTGSGKSYSMVYLCKALLSHQELANCRIIIVTDRVDLEKQLSGTFMSGGAFGSDVATKKEGESSKAISGRDLAKRIGTGSERIIFTLLQKFNSAIKHKECKNSSEDLIVLVDEGHRSQGGENHERMRQALPNAAYIAFTGTPLLKGDKTQNKFGPILHAYTMQRAVEDGMVTPLLYEERRPVVDINETAIDNWFDKITGGLSDKQRSDLKQKYSKRGQIYGAANRIDLIAWDIAVHFNENFKRLAQGLKGQFATDSKRSAIRYKTALDSTGLVTSAIIISAPDTREGHVDTNEENLPEVQKWWKHNVGNDAQGYETGVIEDFGTDGAPDLLIVVDKLLTGFDEPRNAVLYIDKYLKEHNLLQAIARVNRLHEQKPYGFLIDYRGILKELDTSVREYQDLAERTQGGYDIDDLVGTYENVSTEYKRLPSLHDALWAIFEGVENRADREQFRRVLAPHLEEDGPGQSYDQNQKVREDFYEALTEFGMCLKLALSSRSFFEDGSFSESLICTYKDDLRFFTELRIQAKQDAQETVDFSQYETQIRNLVDKHVIGEQISDSDGVIIVNEMAEDGAEELWSDQKTRTETDIIKTRLTRSIEQDLADDPYAQHVFSELLRKAIAEADALFDHPHKQYVLFKDIEEQVRARRTPGVPDSLGDNDQARAYFGAFRLVVDDAGLDEKTLVDEAVHIDEVVREAVASHSINPENIVAEIRSKLLPRYFELLGGLDKAKALIEQVVHIVRVGTSRDEP